MVTSATLTFHEEPLPIGGDGPADRPNWPNRRAPSCHYNHQ